MIDYQPNQRRRKKDKADKGFSCFRGIYGIESRNCAVARMPSI
jgi:hypothetical protein